MLLIYFSPVTWDSFTQRPHEFVTCFREMTNGEVIWVEPYPTRLPAWGDFKRLSKTGIAKKKEVPTWLQVLQPKIFPLEPLFLLRNVNFYSKLSILKKLKKLSQNKETLLVIGKPSSLALTALICIEAKSTLYDAMDDFPSFYTGISSRYMREMEVKVSRGVKQVVVSSTNLSKKFNALGISTKLILNACSIHAFRRMPPYCINKNITPILGYIGTIAQWFDWDILIKLASTMTDYEIRLIGPLHVSPPNSLPANIKIFPPLAHCEALAAMRSFDIGLIPFKCNDLTNHVDPIKYYEYRALNIPILSSRFGQMAYREFEVGVHFFDIGTDFRNIIETILEKKPVFSLNNTFIEKNSWINRFKNIISDLV